MVLGAVRPAHVENRTGAQVVLPGSSRQVSYAPMRYLPSSTVRLYHSPEISLCEALQSVPSFLPPIAAAVHIMATISTAHPPHHRSFISRRPQFATNVRLRRLGMAEAALPKIQPNQNSQVHRFSYASPPWVRENFLLTVRRRWQNSEFCSSFTLWMLCRMGCACGSFNLAAAALRGWQRRGSPSVVSMVSHGVRPQTCAGAQRADIVHEELSWLLNAYINHHDFATREATSFLTMFEVALLIVRFQPHCTESSRGQRSGLPLACTGQDTERRHYRQSL